MPSLSPRQLAPPLVVVALAAAVVLPSLGGDFVLDDRVAIVESVCVTGDFDPGLVVRSNFWCEQGAMRSIQSWRPWPVLVWWPLWHLGLGALPFRLVTLVLHASCTLLSAALGRDLGLSPRAAWIGAAVFAALAIHVDALGTAVGHADLWAALWTLLALRAFVRARWRCVAFVGLAVVSKESGVLAVPLLAVFALVRYRPGHGPLGPAHRWPPRKRWLVVAVCAAAMLAVLAARAEVLGAWTGTNIPVHVNPLVAEPWSTRALTAIAIVGRYHVLTAAGYPLSADYAQAAIEVGVFDVYAIVGLAAGVGWIALAWTYRHNVAISALSLWILGMCAFVSNLPFVLPAMFAERLFYLPSIAIALLLGLGYETARERRLARPVVLRTALGLFIVVQGINAMRHAWAFADAERIMAVTVQNTPDNARARMWLAVRQLRSGDQELARTHAEAAAAIRPDWGLPLAVLSALQDLDGHPQRALVGFRRAMQLDPQDPQVADLFIQFLLRYGHRQQAAWVYETHSQARHGVPDPRVTRPPPTADAAGQ